MKQINLNTQANIRIIIYPDGQPHVILQNIEPYDEVKVVCAINSVEQLFCLMTCAQAIDHLGAQKSILVIPYLMAARSDRHMQHGDSFDLKVVADMINSLNFEKVMLFDPHSDISLNLIDRAQAITNKSLVMQYTMAVAVLICPDAGAARKVAAYAEWNPRISDMVTCSKSRNLTTGQISLTVNNIERCNGKNCVIIDDICDGGATFLAIAQQIDPAHLTLIVSHGIFSKGTDILYKYFDEIITSDSYTSFQVDPRIKVIALDF